MAGGTGEEAGAARDDGGAAQFGSKLGFWSQVHLGLVTPNWEFCETDDSEFAGLVAEGIQVRRGLATVEGAGLGVALRESGLEAPSVVLSG